MTLQTTEIHVWLVSLEPPDAQLRALTETLDAAERDRAARYRFERDRRRFTAARGVLRAVLGAYLDTSPANIAFAYGPHGKPSLAPSAGHPALQFNISHSETRALIALTRDGELGVDIEYMRPLDDMDAIARTVFSGHERAILAALDDTRRHEAFYACWARKEAYIKAIGRGLSFPLDSFDVALPPDEPPRLLAVRGNPTEVDRWRYRPLPPVPGYATALAVESAAIEVKCWRWRDL